MANKLNYQQSREIRKTKFSDLFLDTLARKETGVLGSVGKAISLNAQARMKGIKEKFDPLNIVKFLTFGSKLGPALYGKMAGRDQKDIDYFTGRSRHITGGRNTADKIKGKGGGDNEGINEQLAKIFTFLKSSREDDVKLKQQAKNSEEEINMEKDRRHKELLKTLEKLMKQIGGGSATATKEGDRSFLDGILASIKAMKDQLSNFMSLLGGLDNAKWLRALSGGPVLLIPALVAGGIWYAIKEFKDNDEAINEAAAKGDVKTLREKITAGLGDEGIMYAGTDEMVKNALTKAGTPEALNALKTIQEGERPKTTADKYDQFLADKGYYKSMGYKNLKGQMVPDDLKKAAEEYAGIQSASPVPSAAPTGAEKETAVPVAPAGQEFDSDGGLIKSPVPKTPVSVSSPASAPVSNLTNTNVDLNMPSDNSGNSGERMSKTNNVAMNSRSKGRSGLMPSQISVRNEEPTYNELIAASTRML